MRAIAKLFRIIHINIVLLKHGLDKLVWSNPVFRPLNFLIIFFPWRWFSKHEITGTSIRLALQELGPIFVKFGQLLSTRRDLLPDDIANELEKLQDKVPPFSGTLAKKLVEKSLGNDIESLFAEFNLVPLASASISQVHSATLHDGSQVAVKVLRPRIHQHISRDIELLETFANIVNRFVPKARRFKPIEVVQEFKSTLMDELDLMREAANASQLRRNFHNSDMLYVPEVHWEYTRTNVMVTELIHGVPISNIESLKAHDCDLKLLAERGVEIFFTQVFRDCFFHADMHPGNIFVCLKNPKDPQYIAVDFGIIGTLGPEDQRYLAENFLAFFHRDYRQVALLHIRSGWVPPNTPVDEFESAIRTVCEPIFEKPLKDISFGQTLLRLFQTARRFNMPVQPQLLLLQKTLLSIEGLGRQLYPDLDLWHTAKPFLEKWMKTQVGPKAIYENVKQKFPQWTNKLPELPEAVFDIVDYFQHKTQQLRFMQLEPKTHDAYLNQEAKSSSNKGAIFAAGLIISSTILYAASPISIKFAQYNHIGAAVLASIALILLVKRKS